MLNVKQDKFWKLGVEYWKEVRNADVELLRIEGYSELIVNLIVDLDWIGIGIMDNRRDNGIMG